MVRRNRFVICLCVLFLLVGGALLFVCWPARVAQAEGICITVWPEEDKLQVEIANATAEALEFGTEFHIEKLGLFGWYRFSPWSQAFTAPSYTVAPGGSWSSALWSERLSCGVYRLVKPFEIGGQEVLLAGEFEVR